MKKILVHLADGFEEVEAVTPVDVLRRAGCDVITVSITDKYEVTSKRGVKIISDQLFKDTNYDEADMIILPGGQPGADNLNKHEGLKLQIRKFYESGKLLAAICAAPLVFGNMGILKGKRVTCFPGVEPELSGASCTGNNIEVDGNIITGKGPGVALAFSFVLAEKFVGSTRTNEIKKAMIAE